METMEFWIRFVLAVLATWRVTHLLANEDGPADLIVRLRSRLGDSLAGQMMDCFNCLSLWIAARWQFSSPEVRSNGCLPGWRCPAPPACCSGLARSLSRSNRFQNPQKEKLAMCCGQKRQAQRNSATPSGPAIPQRNGDPGTANRPAGISLVRVPPRHKR